jgi:hypothetical protein
MMNADYQNWDHPTMDGQADRWMSAVTGRAAASGRHATTIYRRVPIFNLGYPRKRNSFKRMKKH